ncbi:MAG: hypothetical protein AVDCRST_MAG77-1107 [uncultured Chloroflexi bacterium]|uniref:Uncharacterized protein n=1 Tax=uncultured Chloroflexota bacterium TaxID=166587 RepID=A0A6J4HTI9_9CHLR|nr:MAG: hypothetical protein AVDCRST_MAG77-1107 [uncultured Chloroflexota bacterium]
MGGVLALARRLLRGGESRGLPPCSEAPCPLSTWCCRMLRRWSAAVSCAVVVQSRFLSRSKFGLIAPRVLIVGHGRLVWALLGTLVHTPDG